MRRTTHLVLAVLALSGTAGAQTPTPWQAQTTPGTSITKTRTWRWR